MLSCFKFYKEKCGTVKKRKSVKNGVRKIAPEENCPPARVRVWFRISVRIRAEGGRGDFPWGQFS